MYGLTMIKDYLNEILDGIKTYDVRTYPTNKKGIIALIDSKTMKIYGTVELIKCREITKEEYITWHKTGKYKDISFNISNDNNIKYYAYDFINPKRIINNIQLNCDKHTWIELPNNTELYYKEPLF